MQDLVDLAGEIAAFGCSSAVADVALVDGAIGIVVAPRGRLSLVLAVEFSADGRIAGYELIADAARLRGLDMAVPEG